MQSQAAMFDATESTAIEASDLQYQPLESLTEDMLREISGGVTDPGQDTPRGSW